MTFVFRKLAVTLLLLLTFSVSHAATVSRLYETELLVPEQLNQPSQEQLVQGLKQVLIKVSGTSQVVNKAAVVAALRQPDTLLQQYSYQSTQTPVSAGDGREVLGQSLLLEFDPVLVDQLLQNAGLRAVGHARPGLMVWLAAQRGNAVRDFVAPDSNIYSDLAEYAYQRGLPLEVPLLDLTDQENIEVSDLWGFFRPQIEAASSRYQPDAILAGRLIQTAGGGWQTEWLLLQQGQARSITPRGSLAQQLKEVIETSADLMLVKLGPARFNYVETGMKLEVVNVDSIDDYLNLVTYLKQLPAVENVKFVGVEADRASFRVELQGGTAALDQAVRLDPRMASMSQLGAGADSALIYRWQE